MLISSREARGNENQSMSDLCIGQHIVLIGYICQFCSEFKFNAVTTFVQEFTKDQVQCIDSSIYSTYQDVCDVWMLISLYRKVDLNDDNCQRCWCETRG